LRPADGESSAPPPSPAEWAHEMRRAIFCPVMPGDNTFRMRLFHAVRAGCIPVVIRFPGGSWYRNHGPVVEDSLPFANSGVDWHGLAIELPFDPDSESFFTWAKRLVPSLLKLGVEDVRQRQEKLMSGAPILQYDFLGSRPDAFTSLLDQLAGRAKTATSSSPRAMECFDPRHRFNTKRCLSGSPAVEREESEIYGVVACCPAPATEIHMEKPRQRFNTNGLVPHQRTSRRWPCNVNARGRCVRLPFDDVVGRDSLAERIHLRRHLQAVFARKERFEELLPEDQICSR